MKLVHIFERSSPVDVAFVRQTVEDNYEILSDVSSGSQLAKLLTELFSEYNMVFKLDQQQSPNTQRQKIGIIRGQATSDNQILIYISPRLVTSIQDPNNIEYICNYISELYAHEAIHLSQSAKSSGKMFTQNQPTKNKQLTDRQQYFADPHEINAMAYEINQQMASGRMPAGVRLELLHDPKQVARYSARFAEIYKEFKDSDPTGVIKRILKTLYQVLSKGPIPVEV